MSTASAPPDLAQIDTDPLFEKSRRRFLLPPGQTYLIGNSLGPLCVDADNAVRDAMRDWRERGIAGWTGGESPWISLAGRVAKLLSPIVGAAGEDIAVTGSTTVNLHQMLASLFRPISGRDAILIDALAFPTDAYAVQSHLRMRGIDPSSHVIKVPSRDNATLEDAEIEAGLSNPTVAMAVLPAVVFKSGQLLDLQRLTSVARRNGVMIGWDCSHAVGAVPLNLDAVDADFAFWCSYKYLNGGPGAAGGLWVNPRRHGAALPGLAGWFGVDPVEQFKMSHAFVAAAGAARMQTGSPHVLSTAPLLGSLKVFADAGGIGRLRERSTTLTQHLINSVGARLSSLGVRVITPRDPSRRGGHLALAHPRAEELCRRLASEQAIITDHRAPDVLRITPAALYNTVEEIERAIEGISRILS